jgi:hypothetical protein
MQILHKNNQILLSTVSRSRFDLKRLFYLAVIVVIAGFLYSASGLSKNLVASLVVALVCLPFFFFVNSLLSADERKQWIFDFKSRTFTWSTSVGVQTGGATCPLSSLSDMAILNNSNYVGLRLRADGYPLEIKAEIGQLDVGPSRLDQLLEDLREISIRLNGIRQELQR